MYFRTSYSARRHTRTCFRVPYTVRVRWVLCGNGLGPKILRSTVMWRSSAPGREDWLLAPFGSFALLPLLSYHANRLSVGFDFNTKQEGKSPPTFHN